MKIIPLEDVKGTDLALFSFLLTLYFLFLAAAVFHIRPLWGINYVYYLPAFVKFPLFLIGGLAFIPPVNRLARQGISTAAALLASFRRMKSWMRVLFVIAALTGIFFCFFHFFRVISLYHDNTNAISYMKMHQPIYAIYSEKTFFRNKPVLTFFFAFSKFLLHDILGLTPFYSLAVSSGLIGVIFIVLLVKLLNKFRFQPLEYAMLFSLLSAQTIHYYYFGYANYYTIVPFMIFVYVYCAVRYFVQQRSMVPALIVSLLLLSTHMGTTFIIPSLLFLLIHRFRRHFSKIYDFAVFRTTWITALLVFTVVFGVYLTISLGIFDFGAVSVYLKAAFAQPFGGSVNNTGDTGLFSPAHLMHFLNIFLLIMPVGGGIFFILLKYFKRVRNYQELVLFLLWLSIGSTAHILFLKPQSLFAWDIYGWVSVSFIFMGGLAYISQSAVIGGSQYIKVLIITHSFIFFAAWIGLHKIEYAAAANYLDSFQNGGYKDQVSAVIRTVHEQPVHQFAYGSLLLNELEKRASSFQDYLFLSDCHSYLGSEDAKGRLITKAAEKFHENEKYNRNSADDYFKYVQRYSDVDKSNKEMREKIEPLIIKMVSLYPDNARYLLFYADFLDRQENYNSAVTIIEKVDSLYSDPRVSLFTKIVPVIDLKNMLMKQYFKVNNYPKVISMFDAIDRMLPADEPLDEKSGWAVLFSYLQIGNADMAELLIQNSRFSNCNRKATNAFDNDAFKKKGIERGIQYILNAITIRDAQSLSNYIGIITRNNNVPVFRMVNLTYKLFGEIKILNNNEAGRQDSLFTAIECILNNKFLAYINSIAPRIAELDRNDKLCIQINSYIGNWLIDPLTGLINGTRADSLKIYGEKLTEVFPDSYLGYLLSAVYLKHAGDMQGSEYLFVRAEEMIGKDPDVRRREDLLKMISGSK